MPFVQIIEYVTSRFDEVSALSEQMQQARGDGATVRKVTIGQDRDRPNHYVVIAEFDSYESAMQNSDQPGTQEFAARMVELCDAPPTFRNLDVLHVDTP